MGDSVVHADHGIARFLGLKTMKPRGPRLTAQERAQEKLDAAAGKRTEERPAEEFLTLEFAGGSKLHVPVAQIDKVQKYIGGFRGKPPLSTIGGKRWQSQKSQVKEAVRDLAAELLRVQAAREHQPGIRYPADTVWQREFEAEFPYEETEDQLAALNEIRKDLTSSRPMDRLLCGDVGYGKTEVAIRAAFKAAAGREAGRRAGADDDPRRAARRTFADALLADYGRFEVAVALPFPNGGKEQKEIHRGPAPTASVDIVIGTHRILSARTCVFKDLDSGSDRRGAALRRRATRSTLLSGCG